MFKTNLTRGTPRDPSQPPVRGWLYAVALIVAMIGRLATGPHPFSVPNALVIAGVGALGALVWWLLARRSSGLGASKDLQEMEALAPAWDLIATLEDRERERLAALGGPEAERALACLEPIVMCPETRAVLERVAGALRAQVDRNPLAARAVGELDAWLQRPDASPAEVNQAVARWRLDQDRRADYAASMQRRADVLRRFAAHDDHAAARLRQIERDLRTLQAPR